MSNQNIFSEDVPLIIQGIDPDILKQLPSEWPANRLSILRVLMGAGIESDEAKEYAAELANYIPAEDNTPVAQNVSGIDGAITALKYALTPEDTSLKGLMQRWNEAGSFERAELVGKIQQTAKGARIFARENGDGIIDIDISLQAYQIAQRTDPPPVLKGKLLYTIEQLDKQEYPANPITGEEIFAGDLWLEVPEDLRVQIAWAKRNGAPSLSEEAVLGKAIEGSLPRTWNVQVLRYQALTDEEKMMARRYLFVRDVAPPVTDVQQAGEEAGSRLPSHIELPNILDAIVTLLSAMLNVTQVHTGVHEEFLMAQIYALQPRVEVGRNENPKELLRKLLRLANKKHSFGKVILRIQKQYPNKDVVMPVAQVIEALSGQSHTIQVAERGVYTGGKNSGGIFTGDHNRVDRT